MKEFKRLFSGRIESICIFAGAFLLVPALLFGQGDSLAPQVIPHDSVIVREYWRPIGANLQLTAPQASQALRDLDTVSSWTYRNSRFRLYRYIRNGWLEYSSAAADSFAFVPGRVLWLKTSRDLNIDQIDLGSGTQFTDTLKFSLPARGWVDFCVPYRFPIRLSSILNASGLAADTSISMYEWAWPDSGNPVYTAAPVHLGRDLGGDTVLNPGDGVAYTIGNGHDTGEIQIVIPPEAASANKAIAAAPADPGRVIFAVKSWTAEGALNPVLCGLASGNGGVHYYPKPPSFGGASVGVVNGASRAVCGHAIAHELRNGGQTFELAFSNAENKNISIGYTISCREGHDGALQAAIIDPVTGSCREVTASDSLTVLVGPNTSERLLLAVGSSAYLGRAASTALQAGQGILKLTPNPCRGRLSIAFSAGYEATRALCRIVDSRGRTIWNKRLDRELLVGVNRVDWTPSANRAPAPGAYIVSITEWDGSGRVVLQRHSRFTFLP